MDKFAALAEPNRRHIIELLATRGAMPATEISRHFAISAPAVSQHLKVLREAGMLNMEKRSQQRIYSLDPSGVEDMWQWLNDMRRFWQAGFDRLEAMLEEDKA